MSTINLAHGSLSGSGNQMLSVLRPADGMAPFGTNQLAQAHDTNWGKIQVCSALTLWRTLVSSCCSEPGTRGVNAGEACRPPPPVSQRVTVVSSEAPPGDPDACPWAPRPVGKEAQRVPGLCSGAGALEGAVVCVRSRWRRLSVKTRDVTVTFPPRCSARSRRAPITALREEPDPDSSYGGENRYLGTTEIAERDLGTEPGSTLNTARAVGS